ncbi:MAG: hypothetical protein K6A63_02995 [Acholeplasmatales bacterium]|nr:hypothetical protein [Acholeplasmatales bacterium]
MVYLLYNPTSDNNQGMKARDKFISEYEKTYHDIKTFDFTKLDFKEFAANTTDDDTTVLTGGDGTMHFYCNLSKQYPLRGKVFFYGGGTGNDFLNDLNKPEGLVELHKYSNHLPKVKIKHKEMYFVNNVGYGLDGTVCEIADKRKSQGKKINYTTIAAKLLLYKYRRTSATVTVDGVEYKFKKVWLAATMNGRFYGGGMMIAPDQDRLSDKITLVVLHGSSRLKTILAFKTIFTGEHIKKHPDICTVFTGKHIKVEFNRPNAIQVDGETTLNITGYEAIKE